MKYRSRFVPECLLLEREPGLDKLFGGSSLQIALTEPCDIDDAVIVHGEWGRTEEITAPPSLFAILPLAVTC